MKIYLNQISDQIDVMISGAEDLFGAAVTVTLPDNCEFKSKGPGDLLEQNGTPLVLVGPNSAGDILAASTLKRGDETVSGDGKLLTLNISGLGCDNPAKLLSITTYDASGKGTDYIPSGNELPSAGLPLIAALIISVIFTKLLSFIQQKSAN